MTASAILVTILLVVAIVILIRYLGTREKQRSRSKEDPWDHLSSENKGKTDKLGFNTNRIRINRNEGWEFEPTVGEAATPWLKPETDTVLFYERGTVGGAGLIGWIENKEIANHLRKEGIATAITLSFDERSCLIEFAMYDEYEPEIRKKQKDDFKEKLLKPYKPRQDWTLTFTMAKGLSPDSKLQIKHLDAESVAYKEDSIHKSIWLEDENNRKVSEDSYFDYNNLIKTLRAIYSGLDLKIKDIKKSKGNNWELTIGI
jgi:hypothetical protein